MSEFDEKTRVTQVVQRPMPEESSSNDCVVVIYTKEPGLLGKRFVLDKNKIGIGRGADNVIVLEGDSVSRRHAQIERRSNRWYIVDNGSTNGTYLNEEQIVREAPLNNSDRLKVGPTILKFLSGADAEAKYHEEIYRMTIVDGLTQIHNKRYLYEALEREVLRARRHDRPLSILMFDIDFFKRVNDQYGHLAGDYVLRELARVVQGRIRRDEVFARYGGEEFVIALPETPLEGGVSLAQNLRARVAEHTFVFQGERIPVTVSIGAAVLNPNDKTATDLVQRADEKLYEAKRGGRNRVCY
ncbi:MAG: GGDEF domain-containing protein [Polyangiaceae bacterium]|nr:GGDEF domain-containing protein [Polyangiaceae bacterium]MBK8997850.1 GGDEF domain-containing protein [Myxococcales bacterium]MCE7890073.1 GGDEF domain-containing protein [Sorangiineae bacterium PRO1]MCL4756397.1 GGDEF domain-containing protein [Myxococcales bacterium]